MPRTPGARNRPKPAEPPRRRLTLSDLETAAKRFALYSRNCKRLGVPRDSSTAQFLREYESAPDLLEDYPLGPPEMIWHGLRQLLKAAYL